MASAAAAASVAAARTWFQAVHVERQSAHRVALAGFAGATVGLTLFSETCSDAEGRG